MIKTLLLTFLLGVSVLGALIVTSYLRFEERDVVLSDAPVVVHVAEGASARTALEVLVDEGTVVDDLLWRPWLLAHRPGCLRAGLHEVPAEATPEKLFEVLCAPTWQAGRRLMIPEGTNIYQLADRVAAERFGDREVVIALAEDPEFIASLGEEHPSLEGLLFPSTYEFAPDATEAELLERLNAQHDRVWGTLVRDERDALERLRETWGVSPYEVLIVASLVEEEAVVADERPIIARVFYNRLQAGMRLQTDPTCVYGPHRYDEVPSREACRDTSSVYSTYVIDGLPPTPITNPGEASMRAALFPDDDPHVLYFVAMRDGSGRHAFADTYEAHDANVTRYLR